MTLKIKTPPSLPMPEYGYLGDEASYGYDRCDMADQLAARDAQWLELVGPVVDALERLCTHKPRTSSQIDADWDNARAALRAITEEQE